MPSSLVMEASTDSDGVGGGVIVSVRVSVMSNVPCDKVVLSDGDPLVTSELFVAVLDGKWLNVVEDDSVSDLLFISPEADMLLSLVRVADDEFKFEGVMESVMVGRSVADLVGGKVRDLLKLAERSTESVGDQLSERRGGDADVVGV